ncbi:MFS transporter [Fluviispira vulneris]|uniref:MFS transporter n=1 Tax=Fluviispira vulneris TaxID=2763012 RepID=UPI001648C940|nr:MFS transporter [Fluviispira vulneris]
MEISQYLNKNYKDHYIITVYYFISHLTFFGFLFSLVLILANRNLSPDFIALSSLTYTITYRSAKLLLSYYLDSIEPEIGIALGSLIVTLGFIVYYFSQSNVFIFTSILLIGLGVSITSTASKVFSFRIAEKAKNKSSIFSLILTSVNIAGAISQPGAILLLNNNQESLLIILFIACMTILMVIFTILAIKNPKNNKLTNAKDKNIAIYFNFLKNRSFLLVAFNFFILYFMYGQIYNTIAYHIGNTLHRKELLASYYFFISIIIISLQIVVTNITDKLDKGDPYKNLYRSSFFYCIAFLLIYYNCADYIFAAAIIFLIALAEILFCPALDVLSLNICGSENKAIWVSLLSLSMALGESLGGGFGIWIYGRLQNSNDYWLYLSIATFIVTIYIYFSRYLISPMKIREKNEGLPAF